MGGIGHDAEKMSEPGACRRQIDRGETQPVTQHEEKFREREACAVPGEDSDSEDGSGRGMGKERLNS
eukprot:792865-Rhodomonas_salina.2